jgi:hypothetical protein
VLRAPQRVPGGNPLSFNFLEYRSIRQVMAAVHAMLHVGRATWSCECSGDIWRMESEMLANHVTNHVISCL